MLLFLLNKLRIGANSMRFLPFFLLIFLSACTSSSQYTLSPSVNISLSSDQKSLLIRVVDEQPVLEAKLKNGSSILQSSTTIQHQQLVYTGDRHFVPSIGVGVGAFTGGNVQFGGGVGVNVPLTERSGQKSMVESVLEIVIPNKVDYSKLWSKLTIELVFGGNKPDGTVNKRQLSVPQPN
jgi:hypothetical protein